MKNPIAYWEEQIARCEAILKVDPYNEGVAIDLAYAKDKLRFAWEDDELDSAGLPHPWGY